MWVCRVSTDISETTSSPEIAGHQDMSKSTHDRIYDTREDRKSAADMYPIRIDPTHSSVQTRKFLTVSPNQVMIVLQIC